MFQICILGGHDGIIRPEEKFVLTLMGGCDFKRSTIGRQILAERQQRKEGRPRPKQFFLTILGGVDIKVPTLAEEFLDLRQLLDSGEITMDDWDRATADLGRSDVTIGSFTLMGGFSECELPSEEEEVESLAVQRHLGNIPNSAGDLLTYGAQTAEAAVGIDLVGDFAGGARHYERDPR